MNDQLFVLILCFRCFDFWCVMDPGETDCPRASQFLKILCDSLSW